MNFFSRSRLATLGILAAAAAVCFASLGREPLFETDEGFAATRADSFLRHHTWLLSYDDVGETGPQYHKPPLLYWCIAALFKTIGHNLWAVRLPTALAAFAVMLLTWRIARRYVDDRCALAGAVLLASVPFAVLHMRTAMLEMPLLALLLTGIWSFSFAPHAAGRVFGAGLAGAAALLLKGNAGLYVTIVPLLFGLLQRRFQRRACIEALLVPLVAILPPLLYFALIPEPYRTEMAEHLFVKEVTERVRVFDHLGRHMQAALQALAIPLRWHIVSSTLGLLLLLIDALRRRVWPAWPVLTLLTALPPLWVFSTMVHPFPRYLLPLYPFILVLSTAFIWCATATPAKSGWLLPYALAALALGWGDPWATGPVATALIVFTATRWPPLRKAPRFVALARALLLLGLAIPSSFSPVSRTYQTRPSLLPRPELIPLARQLQTLTPPEKRVLVEDHMKCHTILFYGRRGIDAYTEWMLSASTPGETRYGIFATVNPSDVPHLTPTLINQSGPWKLFRLHISAQAQPWAGILFCQPKNAARAATTLALLDIAATPFPQGFQLLACPPHAASQPLAPDAAHQLASNGVMAATAPGHDPTWRLLTGETLVAPIPPGTRCLGLELIPTTKNENLVGLRIEARGPTESTWRLLKLVDQPFDPTYELQDARLRRTALRALRVRFAPLEGGELRIQRTASEPLNVSALNLLVDPNAANAHP